MNVVTVLVVITFALAIGGIAIGTVRARARNSRMVDEVRSLRQNFQGTPETGSTVNAYLEYREYSIEIKGGEHMYSAFAKDPQFSTYVHREANSQTGRRKEWMLEARSIGGLIESDRKRFYGEALRVLRQHGIDARISTYRRD